MAKPGRQCFYGGVVGHGAINFIGLGAGALAVLGTPNCSTHFPHFGPTQPMRGDSFLQVRQKRVALVMRTVMVTP